MINSMCAASRMAIGSHIWPHEQPRACCEYLDSVACLTAREISTRRAIVELQGFLFVRFRLTMQGCAAHLELVKARARDPVGMI